VTRSQPSCVAISVTSALDASVKFGLSRKADTNCNISFSRNRAASIGSACLRSSTSSQPEPHCSWRNAVWSWASARQPISMPTTPRIWPSTRIG
jgi:hypothetical protein